jgi:hypothetical protein
MPRTVRVLLATMALFGLTITGPAAGGAAHADPVEPLRSGLVWASGAYIPGDDSAVHESFGSWRGVATDVVVTWPTRRTWADITTPHWILGRWRGATQLMSFGVPPIPEGEGASLAACAAGAYDDKWRTFGATMAASGMAHRSIIRLGWELNGNWYVWAARNPAEFAACWRRVHSAAEAYAPALRWDWNVNRGPSQLGIDPVAAYPGDAYVDIIGVDSYDGWPAATSPQAWAEHYSGPYGLRFWADFARAHGKQLSVPEWGVYPGTAWAGHNGGDNPYYVSQMFAFFREQADILAYEAYFNEPAGYYAGALHLNPKAADEYRRQIVAARTQPPPVPPTTPVPPGQPVPPVPPLPPAPLPPAPAPIPTTPPTAQPPLPPGPPAPHPVPPPPLPTDPAPPAPLPTAPVPTAPVPTVPVPTVPVKPIAPLPPDPAPTTTPAPTPPEPPSARPDPPRREWWCWLLCWWNRDRIPYWLWPWLS